MSKIDLKPEANHKPLF